ncbi:MAG: hypothetical protein D6748_14240 [Calditrichaeota bacterium]|nr:MAG: hypothetical protein D6748_14240 [Calditrichota bacterium]
MFKKVGGKAMGYYILDRDQTVVVMKDGMVECGPAQREISVEVSFIFYDPPLPGKEEASGFFPTGDSYLFSQ